MVTRRRGTVWEDTQVAVNLGSGAQLLQRLTPSGFSPGHTLLTLLPLHRTTRKPPITSLVTLRPISSKAGGDLFPPAPFNFESLRTGCQPTRGVTT